MEQQDTVTTGAVGRATSKGGASGETSELNMMLADNFRNLEDGGKLLLHQEIQHNTLKEWILLDSQLTINIISNTDIIKNIHEVPSPIHVHYNSRTKFIHQVVEIHN